jgi:hypothetical protein
MLEYKPDWEQAKQRLEAFWAGEELDRPIITITAPNGKKPREIPAPPAGTRALNLDWRLDTQEEQIRCTYYGGEAVPSLWPDLGPNITAACIGGHQEIHDVEGASVWGSYWTYPVIEDWDRDLPKIHFDPENIWYKRISEFTRLATERARGNCFVAVPDVAGGADTCESLRGGTALCADLYENPDRVRQLLQIVREENEKITRAFYQEMNRYHKGGVSTFRVWSPGISFALRNDFSYMISPAKFREMFLEAMIEEAELVKDSSIFHCHNEDELARRDSRLAWLDVVCDIPQLKGIQWELEGGWEHFHPEPYKHILDAGKFVIFWGSVAGTDIPRMVEALGSKRLWFITGASCPEEADAIVKQASQN